MLGPNLDPERYKIASYNGLALIDMSRQDEDGYDYEMDVEFLRYTGLNDRNNKEIYEDSIVLITGEQELDYGLTFQWNEKAIVRWSDEECGFYLDVINKREVNLCQDGYFTVDTFSLRKWNDEEWWIEYEVIGNIYENPELIGGGAHVS